MNIALLGTGAIVIVIAAALALAFYAGGLRKERESAEEDTEDANNKVEKLEAPIPDAAAHRASAWRRLREAYPKRYAALWARRFGRDRDGEA